MPNQDAAQPVEQGPSRSLVPVPPDARARARRRAEVLRRLSRQRRRQRGQESASLRRTGTETA
jgi:hypothetical protein